MSSRNLSYSLFESGNTNSNINVSYEDLLEQVNEESQQKLIEIDNTCMDDIIALELEYRENYTKKQLDRIADYYEIPKRKKKKDELIQDIVLFEKEPINCEITEHRKLLWFYVC